MEGLRNGRKGAKGMEESQGEGKETEEHGRENIGASNGANAERNVTLLELSRSDSHLTKTNLNLVAISSNQNNYIPPILYNFQTYIVMSMPLPVFIL